MSGAGRVLAVCADDVGLVAGAADTVLALATAGRITAASCVTSGALWRSEAGALRGVGAGLELGLHFNLSEGVPLSRALAGHWPAFPGLGRLILLAHLGRLPQAAIAAEWAAQREAFVDAVGREPSFVDGHQHVHALPGVREIMLEGAMRFAAAPAIRNTGHVSGPAAGFKGRVIEATGGRALERALQARGLRHNRLLLGAYDFQAADYGALVGAWLAATPAEGGLLFCHPCRAPTGRTVAGDAIAAARAREAGYLASDRFAGDLARAGVSLGSAWAKRSSSAG